MTEKDENKPTENISAEAEGAEPTLPAEDRQNADGAAVEDAQPAVETEERSESEAKAPAVTTVTIDGEAKSERADSAKKKKIKRILWNLFLVAVIAAGIISMFGIVKEMDPNQGASFGEVFGNASWVYMIVLVAVVLAVMALGCLEFCIISKTVTGKYRVSSSVKTSFLGKYYDAVTPFSTGGQPMQIYYLNTKGISGGSASAMVLIRYFASILTWMALGAALMIWGTVEGVLDGISGANILKITGWIGIGINLIIPLFVTLFLVFPKFMFKLTTGVVRLGKKVKIVKDEEKATARALRVVSDFRSSFKVMATTPFNLILLLLICLAEAALNFAIPFFVMKAFSCNVDGMAATIMALNAFATFGVSFIPTPGNSGVVEGMGALAFSAAAGPALAWSVLLWRMGVFYIYILVGLGITVRDMIKKNLQARKKKDG